MHILIVEDNRDIADNIADYLEIQNHSFDFAADGLTAIQKAHHEEYDAIVLDVMLPGTDGFSVAQNIRAQETYHTPIIMLTARDTLDDKLTGFNMGVDDYLVKPFALPELMARLKVIVARHGKTTKQLEVGTLTLDPTTRAVSKEGTSIKLNNTCFSLLHHLMQASPRVVSRDEIELKLWGNMPPGSDVLRTTIYSLRGKVDKPFNSQQIETVHGVGFKICP